MAYDLSKLRKYTWFAAVYGFYAVFAAKYPTDPFNGMYTDLKAWMVDPVAKLKNNIQVIIAIIALVIVGPMLTKVVGGRMNGIPKMIVEIGVQYFIGDELGRLVSNKGVVTGATYGQYGVRPAMTWGGENSAFQQGRYAYPAGVVDSSNYV